MWIHHNTAQQYRIHQLLDYLFWVHCKWILLKCSFSAKTLLYVAVYYTAFKFHIHTILAIVVWLGSLRSDNGEKAARHPLFCLLSSYILLIRFRTLFSQTKTKKLHELTVIRKVAAPYKAPFFCAKTEAKYPTL